MYRTSILTALCIVLIGFGVPALSMYFSVYQNLNSIIAGLIALLALIVAGLLAVIGIAIGSEATESALPMAEGKLDRLREHQRATLEEIDDVVDVLKEIRDLLKAAQE